MSASRKYQVVLPAPVAAQLEQLAHAAGERSSTLAGQLVRNGVALAAKDDKVPQLERAPVIIRDLAMDGRAPWLEPWGGDADWRADMWGQIVALHGRYPRALAPLKHGWWSEEQYLEALCALALWRAQIDDSGVDPREELAFHAQLVDYSALLRKEGGGVTQAWKPGAPPEGWLGRSTG